MNTSHTPSNHDDNTSLFRQKPLERLSNPEQLDSLLVVVTPKMWIAFLCLAILLIGLILWSIFGSIPITVHGKGIIMSERDSLATINSSVDGMVKKIYINPGDTVTQGQPIAEIIDHSYELQVAMAKVKVDDLKTEIKALKAMPTNSNLNTSEVAQLHLIDTEHALKQAQNELSLLNNQSQLYKIQSPIDGKILEVLTGEGEIVKPGSHIVWMESLPQKNATYQVYAYFPIEQGKRLNVGTPAFIAPSTVDTQEFGFLTGKVTHVSNFAASRESLTNLVNNKELIDYLFSGDNAVIAATIELDKDTADHYRWTSGKTPPATISTGTVASVQATVHRIRPIYYMLPLETLKNE